MLKDVKFGGSSLADANQFHKVADIIKSDPSRRYVIASAPGKRDTHDAKVTDMLLQCFYSVSPISYVNAEYVPTIIHHGNADSIVPFSNAQTLDALLTQYGVEHVLNVYDGADHDLGKDDEAKKRSDELLFGYIDRFLK